MINKGAIDPQTQNRSGRTLEKTLFYLLLVAFLVPVWTNTFFLTGDGPCHVYNSEVILDLISGRHSEFYENFYALNGNPDPNWFSHAFLALCMLLMPGIVAEKLLITVYILSFGLFGRALIKTIGEENSFLAIPLFLFSVTHVFQMGFYNYSMGFALYFLTIWFWLRNQYDFSWKSVIALAAIVLISFFTHPIGYLLSGLTIASLVACKYLESFSDQTLKIDRGAMRGTLVKTIIAFLPSLMLFVAFIVRQGLNPRSNPDSGGKLLKELFELSSLAVISNNEPMWAHTTGILCTGIFLYVLVIRIRSGAVKHSDGFLVVTLIALGIYFFQPGALAGAGILSIRLQFIPYLIAILWFAGSWFHPILRKILAVLFFAIGLTLTIVRIPHYHRASQAVEEYVEMNSMIPDSSIVLPLSFNHGGLDPEGHKIAQRLWLFRHVAGYVPSGRPMVLLDNYEANTNHFPITWNWEVNPYAHLGNIEGSFTDPPSFDIRSYEQQAGVRIDYILTWSIDEPFIDVRYANHPKMEFAKTQLNQYYTLSHTSPSGRLKLYHRR